jgi:DNA mismatch endonuclease (patch repair protein)
LVFPGRRKIIFLHGCFWHQHDCKNSHVPQSNTDYWLPKLSRNVERDAQNINRLIDLGWQTMTIWECELSSLDLPERISRFLGPPKVI